MHIAVLLKEVLDLLAVKPGGVIIDCTLGLAGHALRLLRMAGPTGRLLGIDKDTQALEAAQNILKDEKGEKVFVHGAHGDVGRIARKNGFAEADAIIFDLGVSSLQLDTAERGFSFMRDGSLSMKMDAGADYAGAAEIVAEYDEKELAALFRQYGEEPRAGRIARAIVEARAREPIETTMQLADIIERAVGRTGPKNPATRVFQSLRMKVNSEIEELERALEDGLDLLKPGGRMAVITFESLSDRIVKQHFADHAGKWVSLQQGGECWKGLAPPVIRITRKPVEAGTDELRSNPRARSARLRGVERLENPLRKKQKRY